MALIALLLVTLLYSASTPAEDTPLQHWIAPTGSDHLRPVADDSLALQTGLGGAIGWSETLTAANPGVILWDEVPGQPPTQVPGGNQTHIRISTTVIRR